MTQASPWPFVISRVFDAPRERVFKAWTEADVLMRWFGPKGVTIPVCNLDLRPGGVFHYRMRMPDGKEMWGKWVFREIAAPERIVLVSAFSDKDGNLTRHPFVPKWPLETLSTTTLTEVDGMTTLTIAWLPTNATQEEVAQFDAMRDNMRQGWTGTLEELSAYLVRE